MSKCNVCGDPMPPGEEMFKYHGYSGPCPRPPLTRVGFAISVKGREDEDGALWLDVFASNARGLEIVDCVGPFNSDAEREKASADLLEMMKSVRPN